MIIYILISTILISLVSLLGVVTMALKREKIDKFIFLLVSLSTGTLLGGAFLHLLPEAMEMLDVSTVLNTTLISFAFFFVIEKILHWRHCHEGGDCDEHSFGYMNLIGDGIHNFLDGMIIAGAFLVDINLGIITSIALAFHEIPQEIGDFGVLLHAGFEKRKAIIANLLVALMAVIGGLIGYALGSNVDGLIPYLLPVAAGGFLYIATSDLMPELRKEEGLVNSIRSFALFVCGILIMAALG